MRSKVIVWIFLILEVFQVGCLTSFVNNNLAKYQVGDGLEVSCIGPESANTFVIYLHGVDSANPSRQELGNRSLLEEIAKSKNIRFAVPRAKMQCPNQPDAICWGWKFDQAELEAIIPSIIYSRSTCFGMDKPFSMLGFSNGGYLLTNWYLNGLKPNTAISPISIIASGSEKVKINLTTDNLSKSSKLILIIGNRDQYNFDSTHSLFRRLQTLKVPVQLIEFDGGHALDAESLRKIL